MGTFEIKVRIKIIQYVCLHKLITLQKLPLYAQGTLAHM